MNHSSDRRKLIQFAVAGTITLFFEKLYARSVLVKPISQELSGFVLLNNSVNPGNFHAVFKNLELKEEFFIFLKNVYNIYPEKEFHTLISNLVDKGKTDEEIYRAILGNLSTIKPLFSELTYALPALAKQKKELADQTMEFLKNRTSMNGYLEIGTPGRYIRELKNQIEITGDIALINVTEPSYSPSDIVERGQLSRIGRYVPLANYDPLPKNLINDHSFEVVTNYIGFHHSPLEKLKLFVGSIHRALKPGGTLILRDHDVVDEKMNRIVSLAHDVFNAGLKVGWETNHQEIRNFRSQAQWVSYLQDCGFEYKGRQIFQAGDPTKNALMEFTKV